MSDIQSHLPEARGLLPHTARDAGRSSLAAGIVALSLTLFPPGDSHAQQTRRIVLTDLPFAEQM